MPHSRTPSQLHGAVLPSFSSGKEHKSATEGSHVFQADDENRCGRLLVLSDSDSGVRERKPEPEVERRRTNVSTKPARKKRSWIATSLRRRLLSSSHWPPPRAIFSAERRSCLGARLRWRWSQPSSTNLAP
ncbi:hypothetical protein [Roseiarcus fermentans]|uniref:hypothetical protein n=1 Tax=Roseiarcus fermentans TaxID=1473586 RepID=UPI001AECD9C1|nr:hypothetical protein [Roseiarcus fermentans]